MRIRLLIALTAIAVSGGELAAQVSAPDWWIWHNKVKPTVTADVSLDSASGDFIYRYTLANGADAEQRINSFFLELLTSTSGAAAPVGWEALPTSKSVSWIAIDPLDPAWRPAHELDLASFLSEIRPGASLSGFELRSPCASGATPVPYYVEGYDHLPVQPEEDTAWVPTPNWRDDAVKGTIIAPGDCSAVVDWGNRRPGIDGFLGLVSFANGASLPAGPVTVQVRFARSGEQVDGSTFRAELNNQDVTSAFRTNSRGDLVAVFAVGTSPLEAGRNVVLLKVDGIVSGTTRTATDADRFTFTIP